MRCPHPLSSLLSPLLSSSPPPSSPTPFLLLPLSPCILIIIIVVKPRIETQFICPDNLYHCSSLITPFTNPPLATSMCSSGEQIAMDSDEPHENNQPSFCILHGRSAIDACCASSAEGRGEGVSKRERETEGGTGIGQRLGTLWATMQLMHAH